ncbi:hypothetical protein RRG08_007270 [Elysia crispata]|uniref:Uncharacterized protein n=1 Tax=Elysia crispata TaxID=231223 RepID=A0AAE1DMI7_9GAST|nr:hypothetical protein RRG08_007270 [Elysia crispata]
MPLWIVRKEVGDTSGGGGRGQMSPTFFNTKRVRLNVNSLIRYVLPQKVHSIRQTYRRDGNNYQDAPPISYRRPCTRLAREDLARIRQRKQHKKRMTKGILDPVEERIKRKKKRDKSTVN